MFTNRYFTTLLENMDEQHLLSACNAWIFHADSTLTKKIRDSVVRHSRAWLKKQSHANLQKLFYEHASLDQMLSHDLLKLCIGFLGPKEGPFRPPARESDGLSPFFLVNTKWRSIAHQYRYASIPTHGLDLSNRLTLPMHISSESFAKCFLRCRWESLRIRSSSKSNIHMIFNGIAILHEIDPTIRIFSLENNSRTPILEKLDTSLAIWENLETVKCYAPEKISGLRTFLTQWDECESDSLETLGVVLKPDEVVKNSAELCEIYQLLPPSVETFFLPPRLPPRCVESVLGALPHLQKLISQFYSENGFASFAKFDRRCLRKLEWCKELSEAIVATDGRLSLQKATDILGTVVRSNSCFKSLVMVVSDLKGVGQRKIRTWLDLPSQQIREIRLERAGNIDKIYFEFE